MKYALSQLGRTAMLWLAMMAGTIVSGILVHPVPHPGVPDGPVKVFVAMLLVNALGAVVIAAIAARLTAGGMRKAIILFVTVFLLETGLSSIESTAFRDVLGLTSATLFAIAIGGSIRALVTSIAATLLWRRANGTVESFALRPASIVALIMLYVALYFAAGMFVAWSSDAVRNYYHEGAGFNLVSLLALQTGRGAIWTGLAVLLARRMSGRPGAVAFWTAAAFAVLMAAPLIYPSSIMPWTVRRVHLVELVLANAAFGALAVMLLRGRFPTSSFAAAEIASRAQR